MPREVGWVQEEPKNRGAWTFMSDRLEPMLPETAVLNYFGREESASPAVGSKQINDQEETEIISRALDFPAKEPRQASRSPPKLNWKKSPTAPAWVAINYVQHHRRIDHSWLSR